MIVLKREARLIERMITDVETRENFTKKIREQKINNKTEVRGMKDKEGHMKYEDERVNNM